jgi:hypothetical protein
MRRGGKGAFCGPTEFGEDRPAADTIRRAAPKDNSNGQTELERSRFS